jgi:hypothetical protein
MDFQSIFIFYIMCELFELFYVQRGSSLGSYIANLLELYEKGTVRFLCMHPSFYIVIFTVIYFNRFSFAASILIILKAFDIILKLILLDKIVKVKPLGIFAQMVEQDIPLGSFLKAAAAGFYIVVFYISFSG